jgi:hypothetical protein
MGMLAGGAAASTASALALGEKHLSVFTTSATQADGLGLPTHLKSFSVDYYVWVRLRGGWNHVYSHAEQVPMLFSIQKNIHLCLTSWHAAYMSCFTQPVAFPGAHTVASQQSATRFLSYPASPKHHKHPTCKPAAHAVPELQKRGEEGRVMQRLSPLMLCQCCDAILQRLERTRDILY